MFDPRDLIRDRDRSPGERRPPRSSSNGSERGKAIAGRLSRAGARQSFEDRSDRALADVGMYRSVSYRDLSEAHFGGHPYATRRAVDRMIRARHHARASGPAAPRAAPTKSSR